MTHDFLVDYHVHTSFSQDSDAAMEDQCRAAINSHVREIAFTEHEDYNPDDPTSFFFKHDEYWRELERCRQLFGKQLTIRAGIEISEPHAFADNASAILKKYNWDFVLGSLHWVSGKYNTYLESYFTEFGDWRMSFRRYFAELIDLAENGNFDVLSHIDYPARYGRNIYGSEYNIAEYEDLIRPALAAIIRRGKGIEINTSLLRRGGSDPNPPQIVVNWYREMGGNILTIGTDSHAPNATGVHMPLAIEMARTAGFSHLATFERRNAILHKI